MEPTPVNGYLSSVGAPNRDGYHPLTTPANGGNVRVSIYRSIAMKARTAKKAKGKGPDTSLLIDGLYSARETVCDIRSGPIANQVTAKAEVRVCDNEDDARVDTVIVHWTTTRDRFVDDNLTREEMKSDGESFRLDEIEPWAFAIYRAVLFAKKQGYLPSGVA